MFSTLEHLLPAWLHASRADVALALQVAVILLCAWLLRWALRLMVGRIARRYELPPEVDMGIRRVGGFLIGFGALLLVLERFGVSGSVLWTAFTGFAAVAAVAFFAAWSVLTNVFCAFLILVTRPFRLHDHIELLESSDKPGLRGQVIDMNLIHVILQERHPGGGESVLRIPNSLFFQRATRRWKGEPETLPPLAPADSSSSAPPASGGGASTVVNFP